MQVPEKDFHLSLVEEEQMEKGVPANQRKIYLGFIANFSIDDKSYENGAVALSENQITLFQRWLFGKSLKRQLSVHFLSIKKFNITDKNSIEMSADKYKIVIKTKMAVKFARQLLKNFVYNLPFLPPEKRFEFIAYDYNLFPRIEPELSASQAFQLTLNSYKSFANAEYHHEFVQYYDTLMKTHSPIFDFNDIPISLIDINFNKNTDFGPLFQTLRYCPFTYGLFCNNISRPDFLHLAIKAYGSNSSLQILRAIDCGIIHGLQEFAKIMNPNFYTNLDYIDLSGNKIEDATPFFQALTNYTHQLSAIIFENCGIHDNALSILFNSLTNNKFIRGVKQLCLAGNTIGTLATEQFVKFIKSLNEFNVTSLKKITIGPLPNPVPVLTNIADIAKHLTVLHLSEVKFNTDVAILQLIKITESAPLASFELTKCEIEIEKLLILIQSLGRNQSYLTIRLGFSEMKLNGQKFKVVMNEIANKIGSRLIGLKLDKNHATEKDLATIIRVLNNIPKLMIFSFNYNLKSGMPNVSYRLVLLLNAPSLISLELRGSKSCKLSEELIPLLCALHSNKKLQSLDISGHPIGPYGLQILTNLVRTNRTLRRLKIDGTCSKFRFLRQFYKFVMESPTLVEVPIPMRDFSRAFSIRETVGRSTKKLTRIHLIVSQKLLLNRQKIGISTFHLLSDPDLNKIGNAARDELAESLGGISKVNKSVKETFGLPMPTEVDHGTATRSKSNRLALYNSLMVDEDKQILSSDKNDKDYITIDQVFDDPVIRSEFDSSEASMSTSEVSQVKGGFIFDISDEPESSSCILPQDDNFNAEEDNDEFQLIPPNKQSPQMPNAFVFDVDDDGEIP